MSESKALQPVNREARLEKAFDDTRAAIEEALGYIERQEDGPMTMRAALKEIDKRLSDLEFEVNTLAGDADYFERVARKLIEQRDEVIRQRDLLLALIVPQHGHGRQV